MASVPRSNPPRQRHGQPTRFRCYACGVAFEPQPGCLDYCPQCQSGRTLYAALMQFGQQFPEPRR